MSIYFSFLGGQASDSNVGAGALLCAQGSDGGLIVEVFLSSFVSGSL
jgi:hypothetical protein